MNATADTNDTFNWWYLFANVGALVGLALLPYLVYIGVLIFQQ
ncbi:hypothetical protein [Brumicola blandensis]|uniref:Uncharacterized protein n=1 Tax=Brumicola blandensis TaxID=3075611 RepID=A0AAW8R5A3_9ALTE|nr:hypothetical protein [Alteromonas sp. W409]MDT0582358.1 hypothetical protein [Alteromonas sp. W409]